MGIEGGRRAQRWGALLVWWGNSLHETLGEGLGLTLIQFVASHRHGARLKTGLSTRRMLATVDDRDDLPFQGGVCGGGGRRGGGFRVSQAVYRNGREEPSPLPGKDHHNDFSAWFGGVSA